MDKENGDESNASQYQTEYVGKFAVLNHRDDRCLNNGTDGLDSK